MTDFLIAMIGLSVIAAIGYAIAATARRQREAKRQVYRAFAEKTGLRYLQTDDGTAQRFAADLDAIGRFSSPSAGDVIPQDVVSGTTAGTAVVAFRHFTHFSEGHLRQWFIVGVLAPRPVADRVSVQFIKGRGRASSYYLADEVVAEHEARRCRLVVRAPSPDAAGDFINEKTLGRLGELAEDLPFLPEIQVRGPRVAVYPAGRNQSLEDANQLVALLGFARSVAALD